MQKSMPIVLIAVLAATAAFLSFRPKKSPAAATDRPAAAAVQPAANKPASDEKPAPAPEPAVAKTEPRAWPQAASDIKADPAAVFGSLPNGMRYVIYPNAEPPNRASLRLHIAAGSLMEREDQRGLAHFLEHMEFNGSTHFAPDTLVPKLQQAGIGFGSEVNAGTSFDQTLYMLDLPDISPATMDLGFTVMRDFCDGASLDPKEIESERGIILAEKVTRDSVAYRLKEEEFRTLLPGSIIPERFPIGTEEVIKNAQRDKFADFYSSYYIPSRMTVIVAGDVDPAAMAKKIETTFGSLKNPEKPGADPDLGSIKSPEGIRTAVFADKEATGTTLSLTSIRKFVRKPDTVAKRSGDLTLELAEAMLNRRFERLAKQENSPVLAGGCANGDLFGHAELIMLTVQVADKRWKDALPLMEQELRRALQHGFTAAEIAEAKANVLTQYQQAVKERSTRKSEDIASNIADTINDEKVFSTPEAELEMASATLGKVTPDDCLKAFRDAWETPGSYLTLTTNTRTADTERELAAGWQESTGTPVTAPEQAKQQDFGYTEFGKPGSIASQTEVADMGITQLVLSNNVRVNLKPTDFEKHSIRILARIGSGKLSQPADSPMLDDFAAAIINSGGLGKHSDDELQAILAGRQVGEKFEIDDDAFVLGGVTTPDDFALQMRLMCASITDPGYREEALWQYRKGIPSLYQKFKHTPAGPIREFSAWLHGNDARWGMATEKQLESYTIADAKRWLAPELDKGWLELSIVGDFELEKAVPEILATFGALPKRDKTKPEMAPARKVDFPNAPADKTFPYQSVMPQAIAFTVWRTSGLRGHAKENRRLNLLAEIYQDKLREVVREKLGATYSPNGSLGGSEALDDFGYISGNAVGKAEDATLLLKTMRDQGDKISSTGITTDELDRARKPLLKQIEQSQRDNGYWLNTVMARCQEDPERLVSIRGRDADLLSITPSELDGIAAKYLKAMDALSATIAPEAEPKAATE